MYRISAEQLRSPARSAWRVLACLVMSGIFVLPATAELGGSADTVQADQQRMKGTLRTTAAAGYTLHEIRADTGTTVREFVSPGGRVFGVAWQGPFMPDMRQLLGHYYEQYFQALQNKRARRAPVVINESGLVVESGGRTRSFQGRAYIPQLAPPGVDLHSIR